MVAKVEWHRGELFPLVGFIVPNLSAKAKGVVALLQRAGNGGAVDQGGQTYPELDAALLMPVCSQLGPEGNTPQVSGAMRDNYRLIVG